MNGSVHDGFDGKITRAQPKLVLAARCFISSDELLTRGWQHTTKRMVSLFLFFFRERERENRRGFEPLSVFVALNSNH